MRRAFNARGGQLGSFVLLAVVALLILRPWEAGGTGSPGPAEANAYVVRAVDGDTIEVRIGGQLDDVRYIDMLSRVFRSTLRLPSVVTV